MANSRAAFLFLPDEILVEIFGYAVVTTRDIASFSAVCKRFRAILKDSHLAAIIVRKKLG